MKHPAASVFFALATASLGVQAQGTVAFTSREVHMRAGPARDFPVVAVLPPGFQVLVQGCVPDYSWCDVLAAGTRGWVYAGNISYAYQGVPVPLLNYGAVIGIGILGFAVSDYWHDHYRSRPFYSERHRWADRNRWVDRPRVRPAPLPQPPHAAPFPHPRPEGQFQPRPHLPQPLQPRPQPQPRAVPPPQILPHPAPDAAPRAVRPPREPHVRDGGGRPSRDGHPPRGEGKGRGEGQGRGEGRQR